MKNRDLVSSIIWMALGGLFVVGALQQGLIISGGSSWIFFTRPIAAAFLLISFILLLYPVVLGILGKQRRGITGKE
jgi:TctA family transporter